MNAKKACATCGDRLTGSARARFCSSACKQRDYRANRNGKRNATGLASVAPPSESSVPTTGTTTAPSSGHCAEAQAVIDSLNAEMQAHADLLGQSLKWSAAESAILELIAETFDRRADLQRRYEAADDDRVAVRFSAELRLLEQAAARLLKQVRTEPPAPKSLRSVKASRAAQTRWDRSS